MDTECPRARIEPRIQREAERWFLRLLDEDAADPAGAGFREWLAASAEHAAAYREVERLWSLTRDAAEHPDILAFADVTPAVRPRVAWPRLRAARTWRFAVAALLAIATTLGVGGWYWASARRSATIYTTQTGQQSRVMLKDGSILLLDTHSTVAVRYGRHARRVDLERGRAEFTVKPDPGRPFVVHAGSGRITDVGTTFQVSVNDRDAVDVVLIRGKVSVTTAKGQATLAPGQALQFSRSGVVTPSHAADLSYALGWVHGELVVNDWSLARVIAAMNRYSHVKIAVADPTLGDIRVTGSFPAGDQDLLVRVLETGWPIRSVRASPGKILLYRD